MPLRLIAGPPNSGRAGRIRERFTASLRRGPVLVQPTFDDVFAFERELAEIAGPLLGGTVTTFHGLFEEVARAAGEAAPPPLSRAQRLRLAAAAVDRSSPRLLARSAARPGFATATLELIDELQSSALDPGSVVEGARGLEESAYLGELAAIYAAYVELRDGCGRADPHLTAARAIAALRRDPESWRARPVFLYGFDDLTVEQREMVAALAAATEVTVAITWEDRTALAARARLLADLRELGGEVELSEERTEAQAANTESPLLFHLERGFAEPGAGRMQPDESLVLLRSAGVRGEAEAVTGEVARLLAGGARPGEIAIALRDPGGRGALLGRILEASRIPVAVEGEHPIAATATGDCLLALLRAVLDGGGAADLLRHLRGPRRAAPASVDRLERSILRRRLRGAAEAAEAWAEGGEPPLSDLERARAASTEPRAFLRTVAELARDIAEWPLARPETRGAVPGAAQALELRAGATIASALEELAELEAPPPAPTEVVETIAALRMPLWRGPAGERVRIASPYRLRAGRFSHVFVVSLQDGEFPRRDGGSPFLTDEQRGALGLRPRAETAAEERYLFYSCLSLPTRSLTLSWRASDEAGAAEQRSPLLDDVRMLLAPAPPSSPDEPDALLEARVRGHGLATVVYEPHAAPSEDELARALAARTGEPSAAEALDALGVGAECGGRVLSRLRAAAVREAAARGPGPLRVPAVLEALGARREFGGTTLESYALCSYRWFVDRELRPEPLGPRPEPLVQGGIMHTALERLYREAPGGGPLPRPATLRRWTERGLELVAEAAAQQRLSARLPADVAMRRRVERLLAAFLRREAQRPAKLAPQLLEASFGAGEEDERPPLDLGGWLLHGRIDRVDTGDGDGLLLDYKMARQVTACAKFEREGKLQLPLYLLAVRELWGIDLAAALYLPLGATKEPRPRGMARAGEADSALAGLELFSSDLLEDGEFEALLERIGARATSQVEGIRGGAIDRDPLDGKCPPYCTFSQICRRERGIVAIADPEAEEEVEA